jgi:3-phosphoshikimate 1-carboxyvinyltransferase
VTVDEDEDEIRVDASDSWPDVPPDVVDCKNSGTTMRLTIATAALADGTSVLTGDESLRSRPQGPLLAAIDALGGAGQSTRANGQAPVVVSGPISGGTTELPGDISQYISALLMAGARTEEGVEIELPAPPNERPYIEITMELLEAFGVETRETDAGFAVGGGQSYTRTEPYTVPGDFSSMSYPLAAGAIAGEATVTGAKPNAQGDSRIVDVLDEMGADVVWKRDRGHLTVSQQPLSGVTVDVGDIPDMLPTIAVLGAAADGTTEIVNCEHVRKKETDRVAAMAEVLSKMGAEVTEATDRLTVHGSESQLTGATIDGRNDHRLIMAVSVAALVAEGPTTIRGAHHVDVSFPGFFEQLSELGVTVEKQ